MVEQLRMSLDCTVAEGLAGERLDRVVALVWGCSRAEAARLIDEQMVTVNENPPAGRSQRLTSGDRIRLSSPPRNGQPAPEADPAVPLELIHTDDQVIVVNKAPGVVVHPGSGHGSGTLVNGLLARFPEIASVGESDRPGIVHRLDRGTSGLLMVARTQRSFDALTVALGRREVYRGYTALVAGLPADDRGVIDAPIGRSHRHPIKMAVVADGRPARTHYEVVARFPAPSGSGSEQGAFDAARLELKLETGRTHQIRVHLAAIGHPVVGDELYGGPEVEGFNRPALHAQELGFSHPETGEQLCFAVDEPEDFSRLARSLAERED